MNFEEVNYNLFLITPYSSPISCSPLDKTKITKYKHSSWLYFGKPFIQYIKRASLDTDHRVTFSTKVTECGQLQINVTNVKNFQIFLQTFLCQCAYVCDLCVKCPHRQLSIHTVTLTESILSEISLSDNFLLSVQRFPILFSSPG